MLLVELPKLQWEAQGIVQTRCVCVCANGVDAELSEKRKLSGDFCSCVCVCVKMPSAVAFLSFLLADACLALHVNTANPAPSVHEQAVDLQNRVAKTLQARCGAGCSEVRALSVSSSLGVVFATRKWGGCLALALHSARSGLRL